MLVEKEVCVYVCVELGFVCVERLGCVSLCVCGRTGVGCGVTDVGVGVCMEDRSVCLCVSLCRYTGVCMQRERWICVCLCGERDWGCGGRIGGAVEQETQRFAGRCRGCVEVESRVCVCVCVWSDRLDVCVCVCVCVEGWGCLSWERSVYV